MRRKVLYARLHQNAYAPSVGELGTVFPPQTKTLENLSMSVDGDGLFLEFIYRGGKHTLLVPTANVVIMSLAPEEIPSISAVKVAKS